MSRYPTDIAMQTEYGVNERAARDEGGVGVPEGSDLVDDLRRRLAAAEESAANGNRDAAAELNGMRAALRAKSAESAELADHVARLTTQAAEAETLVAELSSALDLRDGVLSAERGRSKALSTRVELLSDQVERDAFRIKALLASRRLADRVVGRLDRHAAELEERLTTLSRSRALWSVAAMRCIAGRRRGTTAADALGFAAARASLQGVQDADLVLLVEAGVFDASFYLAAHDDVAEAGVDPAQHYFGPGRTEDRHPHDRFDPERYRAEHGDVAQEGVDALLHYVLHGAAEGRNALTPSQAALSPDPALPDPTDPHAPEIAMPERDALWWWDDPRASLLVASGLFQADWYVAHNADVRESGADPLFHFVHHGWAQKRKPNPLFDPVWYVDTFADIRDAGADPLTHYIQHGADEGRSPSAEFDTAWYRSQNPEILSSGENPLAHYLRVGRALKQPTLDPDGIYRIAVLEDAQRLLMEAGELARHVALMLIRPQFHILIEGGDEPAVRATTLSLKGQIYPTASVSATPEAIPDSRQDPDEPDFLIWLRAGDVLSARGLYEFASRINAEPDADLVYADEDILGPSGRHRPFFKPDWSPDTLETFNYVGSAACFRMTVARGLLVGTDGFYDFVLRFTERCGAVSHVRQVLFHGSRSPADPAPPDWILRDATALLGRLDRTGRTGRATPVVPGFHCMDVNIALRSEPLVSFILPVVGAVLGIGDPRADSLGIYLDRLRERTAYGNVEFIVVHDGSLRDHEVEGLHQRGIGRVSSGDPAFGLSKAVNMAAAAARGELLLLLGDDVEPLAEDWLARLVEHFEKPHVGVVGPKLLNADGTTRHVGMVMNQGHAHHVRSLRARDERGYFFSTCGARNYSAVAGACMMTPASLFRQVGGFTEAMPARHNDVDYCLKARGSGRTVVYAPRAELIHLGSRAPAAAVDPSEEAYFMARWAASTVFDPFYNERSLSVSPPTFEIRNNARALG